MKLKLRISINKNLDGNQHWPQYLTTVTSLIAILTVGIQSGWPSSALPKLLAEDHPLHLTEDEGSYLVIMTSLGSIVGDVLFVLVAHLVNRKTILLLGAIPQILQFVLFHFTSTHKVIPFLARFFGGISEGLFLCTVPLYISEISEPKIRGKCLYFFSLFLISGCLFIELVGTYTAIETSALICLSFPLLFLLTFSFMPESPYCLLMKNKTEEARASLKKLRYNNNVEEELNQITNDVRRQMSESGRYKDIFTIKSNRNSLIMILILTAVGAFSGGTAVLAYAQIFVKNATDLFPPNYISTLICAVCIPFSLISSTILGFFGRRKMLLCSIGSCGLFLLLLTLYFLLRDYSVVDVSPVTWLPVVFLILLELSYFGCLQNTVSCLGSEIFATSVKNKSLLLGAACYTSCASLSTKLYQVFSDNYGTWTPFLLYTVCQLFGWIYAWKFVPETNGKTLEEVQQEMKSTK